MCTIGWKPVSRIGIVQDMCGSENVESLLVKCLALRR